MGSDLGFSLFIQWSKDFNPRSPDGERPEIVRRLLETVFISIHAPRMGSDRRHAPNPPRPGYFNPRSPDGERPNTSETMRCHGKFQSTLPGWGATPWSGSFLSGVGISIHAPRMGSDQHHRRANITGVISIHAPRMGSDLPTLSGCGLFHVFQSTLPGWGATSSGSLPNGIPKSFQSTLPGWGATCPTCSAVPLSSNFNPRSPDGERRVYRQFIDKTLNISIHAPRMGSDHGFQGDSLTLDISIHAPRMGSDRENGHLRPRYGQNHPFSTLIVSQIVVDVLGTVRKSQKHQRTSHYEVIKQPERQK